MHVKIYTKNGNSYSIDGRRIYLKRSYDVEDFKDLSRIDNGTLERQRKYIKWGRNYDKNMKRLKKTEKRAILITIFKAVNLNS